MSNRIVPGSGAKEPRPTRGQIRRAPKKQPTQGHSPLGNQGGRHQGGGGLMKSGRLPAMVQAMVSAQINAGISDVKKEKRTIRRDARTARKTATTNHRRALGDLNYIFGETGDYMGAMGQQIDSTYQGAQGAAAANQAALVAQLQQNSKNVAGGVGGTLANLGISNQGDMGFSHDALMGQDLATQQGANNMANLSAQQQGAMAISSLLQGMNAGSKMSQYGVQQNVLNDEMFQIAQDKRDGFSQVREAISDLKGKRGDLTLQQLQALAGSNWAQYLAKGPRKHHRRGSHGHSSSSSSYQGGSGWAGGGGNSGSGSGSGGSGGGSGSSQLTQLLLGALNSKR